MDSYYSMLKLQIHSLFYKTFLKYWDRLYQGKAHTIMYIYAVNPHIAQKY